MIGTRKVHVKEEPDEVSIIKMPYTVIHPWAMMVYTNKHFSFVLVLYSTEKHTHAKDTSIQFHFVSKYYHV